MGLSFECQIVISSTSSRQLFIVFKSVKLNFTSVFSPIPHASMKSIKSSWHHTKQWFVKFTKSLNPCVSRNLDQYLCMCAIRDWCKCQTWVQPFALTSALATKDHCPVVGWRKLVFIDERSQVLDDFHSLSLRPDSIQALLTPVSNLRVLLIIFTI